MFFAVPVTRLTNSFTLINPQSFTALGVFVSRIQLAQPWHNGMTIGTVFRATLARTQTSDASPEFTKLLISLVFMPAQRVGIAGAKEISDSETIKRKVKHEHHTVSTPRSYRMAKALSIQQLERRTGSAV
jgi:hypothetical protein